MHRKKIFIRSIIIVCCLIIGVAYYCYRFYPQQIMPVAEQCLVLTPEADKYHNDCLHPCIRMINDTAFVMVQSPYYAWNNKVENPILYYSSDPTCWKYGQLLEETPPTGFNSDPCVFHDNSKDYVIWRACGTPYCDALQTNYAVLGGIAPCEYRRGYLKNAYSPLRQGDITQCPILMSHNDKYYIYAAWYQYEPVRKSRGLAVYEGTSIDNPDFVLQDTIPFNEVLVPDKVAEIRIAGKHFYLPMPKKYGLWHFDLFEYEGKLCMVWVDEKDDNVMFSISEDWKHFKTLHKPLVNNHYMENHVGYRQYYYKPTAFVKDDLLWLYYTSNSKEDPSRNALWLTKWPIRRIVD